MKDIVKSGVKNDVNKGVRNVSRGANRSPHSTHLHASSHVAFHVFLHAVLHVPRHWKLGNRSCVGNDVMPASALQSAASSSLGTFTGVPALNSATHETL